VVYARPGRRCPQGFHASQAVALRKPITTPVTIAWRCIGELAVAAEAVDDLGVMATRMNGVADVRHSS